MPEGLEPTQPLAQEEETPEIEMVETHNGDSEPKNECVFIQDYGWVREDDDREMDEVFSEGDYYYRNEDGFWIEDEEYYISSATYESGRFYKCYECGDYFKNGKIHCEDTDEDYCTKCFEDNDGRTCDDCGDHYRDQDEMTWVNDSCYCSSCADDHNEIEDGTNTETGYIEITAKENSDKCNGTCTTVPLERRGTRFLENFYDGMNTPDYRNRFVEINETYSFTLNQLGKGKNFYSNIQDFLSCCVGGLPGIISRESANTMIETYKYKKKKLLGSEDHQIELSYIDGFGKERIGKESIVSISEYTIKHVSKFVTDPEYLNNLQRNVSTKGHNFAGDTVEFTLSNDTEHKCELAEYNDDFHSCQIPDNYKCLARGMRDYVTAGTIVPISVKIDGRIVGRMITRVMYNEEGKQFIVLDRLYGKGDITSYTKETYRGIARCLYEAGYDLAVPRKTQHDNRSVLDYIDDDIGNWKKGLEYKPSEQSLRSPKRKYWNIPYSYYHDSYSKAFRSREDNNFFYDYLNKDNFYTLTHDSNGTSKKAFAFNEATAKPTEGIVQLGADRIQGMSADMIIIDDVAGHQSQFTTEDLSGVQRIQIPEGQMSGDSGNPTPEVLEERTEPRQEG